MKKKLFFLCTMLAFSASLGSTTKECITKTDDTVNEVNVGGKQGRLDAKVIPDRCIDCPWCGHPTLLNKSDPIHYCGHCGRDINSVSERKNCAWCNRDNYFSIGENSESCKYCGTNFNQKYKNVECPWCSYSNKLKDESDPKKCECKQCGSYLNNITQITLNAYYSYNGVKSPLIGCKCELYVGSCLMCVGTSYSNIRGEVEFSFDTSFYFAVKAIETALPFSEKNIYFVRIYPGDDDITVFTDYEISPLSTLSQNNTFWKKSGGDYYPCVDTKPKCIKYGGQNQFDDVNVVMNITGFNIDAFSLGFYLAQGVLRAKEFVIDKNTVYPGPVEIYCKVSEEGACYHSIGDRIVFGMTNMNKNYCYETAIHEYGHHVEDYFGTSSIFAGGTHYFDRPSGIYTAWSEGWTECFSAIVQDETGYYKKPRISLYMHKAAHYKQYDLEAGNHNRTWAEANGYNPKKVECIIAELLWDIYDTGEKSGSSDYDGLNIGPTNWFRLTTRYDTTTIEDFYEVVQKEKVYANKLSIFYSMFEERGLI